MKKALMLAGLVLCTTVGFADQNRNDLVADGKKRNEDAYERNLAETGWKNDTSSQDLNNKDSKYAAASKTRRPLSLKTANKSTTFRPGYPDGGTPHGGRPIGGWHWNYCRTIRPYP